MNEVFGRKGNFIHILVSEPSNIHESLLVTGGYEFYNDGYVGDLICAINILKRSKIK